jgi:hypothetical protein
MDEERQRRVLQRTNPKKKRMREDHFLDTPYTGTSSKRIRRVLELTTQQYIIHTTPYQYAYASVCISVFI